MDEITTEIVHIKLEDVTMTERNGRTFQGAPRNRILCIIFGMRIEISKSLFARLPDEED